MTKKGTYPGESPEKAHARWFVARCAQVALPHKIGQLDLLAGPDGGAHDLEVFVDALRWDPRRVTVVDYNAAYISSMQRVAARWPGVRWRCQKIEDVLPWEPPVMLCYLDLMGVGEHINAPIMAGIKSLAPGGIIAVTWFTGREKEGHQGHRIWKELGGGDRVRGFKAFMEEHAASVKVELKFLDSYTYTRETKSTLCVGLWQRVG